MTDVAKLTEQLTEQAALDAEASQKLFMDFFEALSALVEPYNKGVTVAAMAPYTELHTSMLVQKMRIDAVINPRLMP